MILFIEVFQLANKEGKTELESHHFSYSNKQMDLGYYLDSLGLGHSLTPPRQRQLVIMRLSMQHI